MANARVKAWRRSLQGTGCCARPVRTGDGALDGLGELREGGGRVNGGLPGLAWDFGLFSATGRSVHVIRNPLN